MGGGGEKAVWQVSLLPYVVRRRRRRRRTKKNGGHHLLECSLSHALLLPPPVQAGLEKGARQREGQETLLRSVAKCDNDKRVIARVRLHSLCANRAPIIRHRIVFARLILRGEMGAQGGGEMIT